jgi:hypothetical protein
MGWLGPRIDAASTYADYGYTPDQQGEHRRLELQARKVCDERAGENSGWIEVADGTIVCTDKRGRRARNTITVLHRSEP